MRYDSHQGHFGFRAKHCQLILSMYNVCMFKKRHSNKCPVLERHDKMASKKISLLSKIDTKQESTISAQQTFLIINTVTIHSRAWAWAWHQELEELPPSFPVCWVRTVNLSNSWKKHHMRHRIMFLKN